MKQNKHTNFFLVIIIISMAISPAITLGEGNRNLLLIGVMVISPFIILRHFKFDNMDLLLLLFLVTLIIFPLTNHPESMRWSTVMYSAMFGLTFIAYKQLLSQKYFTIINYIKLLKYLIYAYFAVLLIQQFCVLAGLPILNVSNYNPNYPWKLNSLAAEPSHSARIVALLMYSYIISKEKLLNRSYNPKKDITNDKWVWIAFIWTMFTMGSSTAFLFISIVLLKFIRFRNLIPLLIGFGISVLIINNTGTEEFERAAKTISATLTLDEPTIIEADHSASIRIVPILILVKIVTIKTLDGWFGHGTDYVSTFLSDYLPGVSDGISGGGLFQLWIEYGFISFFLFLIFSFKSIFKKLALLNILFWILLVFMYGINNQIVWLCIILLFTNNYFSTKSFNKKKYSNDNT